MRSYAIFTVLAVVFAVSIQSADAAKKNRGSSDSMPVTSGTTYGTAGCGLGAMLIGDKPGFIQVVASLLNSIGGNQTFAISSGTSNCKETSGARSAAIFIKANKEVLEKDIARGSGETIETLAQIYGCADASTFGSTLQSQYRSVFPSAEIDADQVTQNIESTIQADKGLSQQCVQAG